MKPFILRTAGILACLLTGSLLAFGQPLPDSLEVRAKAYFENNGNYSNVYLRWVPTDFETWQWGISNGYDVWRRIIKNGESYFTVGEQLASQVLVAKNILPQPVSSFEGIAQTNEMAGVAAGLMYGDSLEIVNFSSISFSDVVNLNTVRENRFGLSLFAADNSFEVATMMGLGFIDKIVDADKEYFYTIIPINVDEEITVLKKGQVSVSAANTPELPAPNNLTALPGDRTVAISWEKENLDEHYTSYCVEKSSNGGASFRPAHDFPLISATSLTESPSVMQFYDSLAANGVQYIYRVKGKTPFGIMGPYSNDVTVQGIPSPLDAQIAILKISDVNATDPAIDDLKIEWVFPADKQGQINGFDIYRSDKSDGNFLKINSSILAVSIRNYMDANPLPINYYSVKTMDFNGYELVSNPILGQPKDIVPPAAPTGLAGLCSNSGTVTIHWAKNTEADIMGYRVFMSNAMAGDYAQITASWISDTSFQYTINLQTLSEEVYFAVKALDYRQNASVMSQPCTVIRPDIIPPAPPNITKVTAEPGAVHFQWALSSSDDVVEHQFQRKPHGRPGWVTLLTFQPANSQSQYSDVTASVRQYWDYRLIAKDEVGHISSSKIIKAKPVDNGLRDSIQNFGGQLVNAGMDHSYVLLEWDYLKDPDLLGFQIFRGIDSNDLRSYRFISEQEAKAFAVNFNAGSGYGFVDDDLDFVGVAQQNVYTAAGTVTNSGGNPSSGSQVFPVNPNLPAHPQTGVTLRYHVMAKFVDGAASPLSPPVVILIQ